MPRMNTHEVQPPLDVGAILEALRAEVRAQRMARGEAAESQIERELQRSLDEIELNRVVSAHWPLQGRTVPQRVIALINKVVRRYLRWYINPIVEQQNAYNDAVARTLRLLADAYADLAMQAEELQNQEPGTRNRPIPSAGSRFSVLGSSNLQSAIAQLAAQEPPARFPDLELQAATVQLGLREQVSAHWPLPAATLPQKIIAMINKVVRRYLRWLVNPIVEQQNAANAAFTVALIQLVRLDAEQRAHAAARRARDTMKG
ncbi:MAG TPA: hypothetical protein VFT66_13120 [Roseiflexaceae bacterium]|nr:hypothetical protein [Roseiflexaceae bacterium]